MIFCYTRLMGYPQKLFRVPTDGSGKPVTDAYVQVKELTPEEELLSLDELEKKYPYRHVGPKDELPLYQRRMDQSKTKEEPDDSGG